MNTQTQTNEQTRLQSHVDSIADTLNNRKFEAVEEGEEASIYDYYSQALDINYLINADKSLKAVKLLVAFGGPNIWVDTESQKVQGYWWGTYAEAHLNSDICEELEQIAEEFYNC